jgi:hypothetical protein
MPTELAEAKPADSALLGDAARLSEAARPLALSSAGEVADNDRRLSAARGIMTAVLISSPFWVLLGVAIYMLV